jgi:hypothetical protein
MTIKPRRKSNRLEEFVMDNKCGGFELTSILVVQYLIWTPVARLGLPDPEDPAALRATGFKLLIGK